VTFDPVYGDSATFYEGTVHTHPEFDAPIPGIAPATLPTARAFLGQYLTLP
jgi:hypothetical protein